MIIRQLMQFTGKERDAETGLDYFGARYLSSAQGRFISPDVPLLDQHPDNPQSWNLYSYTSNNMTVTFDLSQHMNKSGALDLGSLAVSAAHEGIHTGHGTAYVGALPMDLTSAAAAGVLAGPLNLTKYATEFAAYSGSSFTAQGLGFGSLKVGGNFEIWNTGWKAADVNTLRSNGINAVLSDPNGLYKVTPGAPGKKIGE